MFKVSFGVPAKKLQVDRKLRFPESKIHYEVKAAFHKFPHEPFVERVFSLRDWTLWESHIFSNYSFHTHLSAFKIDKRDSKTQTMIPPLNEEKGNSMYGPIVMVSNFDGANESRDNRIKYGSTVQTLPLSVFSRYARQGFCPGTSDASKITK
jgi:hypothetical protein